MPRFTDNSPGGFFDNIDSSANNSNSANRGSASDTPASGGGTVNPAANNSAAESASDARDSARASQGWAVGNNTAALTGWSSTNNSMYWSEQARQTYTNTQTLVAGLDTDALRAILAQTVAARTAAQNAQSLAAGSAAQAAISQNQALGYRNTAENFANAAGTSASNAASSASNAQSNASAASTSATNAANSATAASGSATQAATSATQSGTSATASANSATQAATSATNAATSATTATTQRNEASTFATNASNSATLAMNWALDTESGSNAYNQNSARYWARQAAASAAANTVYDSDITVTVGSHMTGGGTFSLNQDSDETINIGLGSDVIVNAVRSGNDITLTKQSGATVQFTINQGGGGNVTPPGNQSHVRITLAGTGLTNDGFLFSPTGSDATVTATISVPTSGYSLVSSTTTVHDVDGDLVTTNTNASFSFSVPTSVAGATTIRTTAVVRRASDDSEFTDTATTYVHVDYQWYFSREAIAPNSVADLAGQGAWQNAQTTTFVAPAGTNPLYVAIPSRNGGYHIADGDTTLIPARLGTTFDTHWTLYHTTEAVAGTTYYIVEG